MSGEDYNAKVAEDLVNDKFDGSIQEFVSLVKKYRGISAKEKKELISMLK